ncbi:SRPBCC family protein [Bacteroidota bacterium]
MPLIKISVKINKPVKEVYKAYVDPKIMVKWMSYLEKFECNQEDFGKIGAIAYCHYNQNGRKYIMEDKLEYLDPEKKIISTVSGNGLKAKVETIFNSFNDKTEIVMIWIGKGKNLLLIILLPFLKNKIKKQAQGELDKFKRLVESN